MKENMWTTEMLLDCIFRSGIKTSWRIKENKYLEHEQAKIIDSALLKIIGNKKPIPEKVLVMKYNFSVPVPDTGILSGNKSLEEILAAL